MNSEQQKEFLQATAWIRPLTKWSALFAFKTQSYLPMWIRDLPLKAIKKLLNGYQKKYQAKSCKSS
jgi:hypothetical protein